MTAIPYLSAIRFSGIDAGNFLHNQLSADVLGIPDNGSAFACYCEPKGRVLALMLVYRLDDNFYIIMSGALTRAVTERLKIYVMRSKVNIEVLNEYAVSGLEAGAAPPLAAGSAILIPLPGEGRSLALARTDIAAVINQAASDRWKASELQRGICWLSVETSAEFLPQMLGFDQLGAVNFRKGCYPGQEIVARTHYLGKVKRHARVLLTNGALCPDLMDKIEILSNAVSHEAIVADCARSEAGDSCLFVVTRMEPELKADQIVYRDQAWATM